MCTQKAGAVLAQAMSPIGISRVPSSEEAAIVAAQSFTGNPRSRQLLETQILSITNELRKLASHYGGSKESRIAGAFFGNIPETAELPETLALL